MLLKDGFYLKKTVRHGFMDRLTEMYITGIHLIGLTPLRVLKILMNRFLQLLKKRYWIASLKTSAVIAEKHLKSLRIWRNHGGILETVCRWMRILIV